MGGDYFDYGDYQYDMPQTLDQNTGRRPWNALRNTGGGGYNKPYYSKNTNLRTNFMQRKPYFRTNDYNYYNDDYQPPPPPPKQKHINIYNIHGTNKSSNANIAGNIVLLKPSVIAWMFTCKIETLNGCQIIYFKLR